MLKIANKYKHKKSKLNKKLNKKEKTIRRFRRMLKNKRVPFNKITTFLKKTNKITSKITIKITPNNIFCTHQNLQKKITNIVSSAGKYKLNVSKKALKFKSKIIIGKFIKELKRKVKKNTTIFILFYGPRRLISKIIKQFSCFTKKNKIIIKKKELKCFNGCIPKKKRKKKRKGLRIFK